MSRGTLGLVGAGAVGPPLARLLREAGWEVGTVASRRLRSAREAVRFIGGGHPTDRNAMALDGASLLILAVPDGAIATVAGEIAEEGVAQPGLLAMHLSGALSSEVLAPLRAVGASVGSLHPLQSFADPESAGRRIRESYLFFEGDEPERVRAVAADLGGRPVPLSTEAKVLYHAGAAAACNLAVTMVDVGVSLLAAAGIPREEALKALLPLLAGTVANLEEVGLPAALTGPVARGDVETIRRHLRAIRRERPDLLDAYREASRHAIRVGRDKGSLDEPAARRMDELLR